MSPRHIRDVCLEINDVFDRYDEEFGIDTLKVNCGVMPGDGTGDTMETGLLKVLKNLQKILDEIQYRIEYQEKENDDD